jgi:hypothetical protein
MARADEGWERKVKGRLQPKGTAGMGGLHHYYEPQHTQPTVECAFEGASSSSACVAHVGVLTDERKTLSLFFNSFSRSIMSFLMMIAVIKELKRLPIPR